MRTGAHVPCDMLGASKGRLADGAGVVSGHCAGGMGGAQWRVEGAYGLGGTASELILCGVWVGHLSRGCALHRAVLPIGLSSTLAL